MNSQLNRITIIIVHTVKFSYKSYYSKQSIDLSLIFFMWYMLKKNQNKTEKGKGNFTKSMYTKVGHNQICEALRSYIYHLSLVSLIGGCSTT